VLKIARSMIDEMVAHALEDAPLECCGVVAAEEGVAVRVYRCENIHASPLRYEVGGPELARRLEEIEDAGWTLGAIYHSHTRSPPYPSQTDINMALFGDTREQVWPGALYVIVGVAEAEPDVRAYAIEGDGVREVALSVE
jgi:[CysO sulfur-carrier protein]-S-L-cysteine hydrolase